VPAIAHEETLAIPCNPGIARAREALEKNAFAVVRESMSCFGETRGRRDVMDELRRVDEPGPPFRPAFAAGWHRGIAETHLRFACANRGGRPSGGAAR